MRVSVASSIASLLVLLLANVKADFCADHANGCSIPFRMPFLYKDLFTPSCNRHDICYRCGEAYGKDQLTCDDAFLADMKSACQHVRRRRRGLQKRLFGRLLPSKTTLCEGVAYNYYLAVRVAGHGHYQNQAWDFCGNSSVTSCLP